MSTRSTRQAFTARPLPWLMVAATLVTVTGCVVITPNPASGPSQAPAVAAPTTTPVASTAAATTTSTATTPRPASSTTRTSSATDTVVFPPADVVSVTDGDTFRISLEGTEAGVRVLGIDTPEMNYGTNGKNKNPECGAREATSHLYELLFDSPRDSEGDGLYDGGDGPRKVVLTVEPDTGDVYDEYGRLLAYVSVDGQDVGRAQITAGWAWAYPYKDRQFGQRSVYEDDEEQARDARDGGWSACPEIFR